MIKLIIPLTLAAIGTGSGIGAAIFLAPPTEEANTANVSLCGPDAVQLSAERKAHEPDVGSEYEFVKLNNQFVVPVVHDERVKSLVVVSLTLEIAPESKDLVFAKEPKLRGAFLQSMFDHANLGGFDGNFTGSNQLNILRQDLYQDGRAVLGPALKSVLIVEIARQDA
ncbi:flagellar basal body-associated protein FliL [Primorskyibacter marinus]|uniref:flagellar basal body-associated protein FliL n=1 Tax=Primorskyibacter marinus TaxID=1977320 RepID=UPI001E42E31E|nr:flagellar basal body-associated protein FliL [Primorskyibacter marinus]